MLTPEEISKIWSGIDCHDCHEDCTTCPPLNRKMLQAQELSTAREIIRVVEDYKNMNVFAWAEKYGVVFSNGDMFFQGLVDYLKQKYTKVK